MNNRALRFILIAGLIVCFAPELLANVSITMPTGGQNISADKAQNSISGAAFTPLGSIVITEGATTDFDAGNNQTLILTAPNGWRFNAGVGSVSFQGSRDITAASIAVTSSNLTVTLSVGGVGKSDVLTISGLEVQVLDGANAPSAGYILRVSTNPGTAGVAGIQYNTTPLALLNTIAGAARALGMATQPPAVAFAGALFNPQPEVSVLDQFGNFRSLDTTTVVTAARAAGSGTLQGTLSVTAIGGVASFTNLYHNVLGTITIQFTATNLVSVTSSNVLVKIAPADRLVFTTQPASAIAGAPFGVQPVIRSQDIFGSNSTVELPGSQLVTVNLSSGTGTLLGTTTLDIGTNAGNGVISFTDLQIDAAGSSKQLTATSSGMTNALSSSFTVAAGAFTKLQVLAPGETAAPGTASGKSGSPTIQNAGLPFNVTVNAVDNWWNAITNVTHTVAITSSDGLATLPANAALVAGTKNFSVTLNTLGSPTVTAKDLTDTNKTANTSSPIPVPFGAPRKLTIQTQPSATATAGVVLAQQPVLRVEDSAGNLITNDTGRVITAARGTGTGTLQGTLTATTLNGVATFNSLSYNVAETITLNFTASGLTNTVSSSVVVSPATADHLVFTTQPGGTSRMGSSWASQPVVKAQDPFGNSSNVGLPANLNLSLALTSGSGSLLGTTTLDVGTAAGNGTATFTNLQCSEAGVGKQLTASASGLTSATSAAFMVGGAVPATGGSAVSADTVGGSYTLLSGPTYYEAATGDVGAGTIILNAPTGFVFDTTNTPAPTVIVTRLSGSGGNTNNINDLASGTAAAVTSRTTNQITFTVSAASASGVTCSLTWTNVRVRPSAGTPLASGNLTKTGTATMAAVTASNTSFGTLSEVAGAATRLAFSTQPGSATAGAAFGTQPVVRSRDQFGNDSTSGLPANRTVTLTLSSGTGPLLGTTTADIGTAAGNGVASFSGLEIDSAGTNKQLTAAASAMTNASSSVFTVSPTSASRLTIQTQPSAAATAGVSFAQQPVIRIEDAFGNLRSTDNSTTVTASRNAGSGTLQGTTTLSAVNGVVSFTNLSHQVAGTITVDFSSGVLAGATSANVVVSPAAASKLTIQTQPSASATAGVVFAVQPVIRIEDAFGNLRSTDSLTVTATRSAGSGTLQGTTSLSAVNGVATFNNLSHTVATNITILFASGSLTSATSGSIAVNPAAATTLVFITQPGNATAGSVFGTQPMLKSKDTFGNFSSAGLPASLNLTLTLTSGTGPLQGTATLDIGSAAGNGVATFSDLRLDAAGTNKQLTASASGLAGASSSNFTVSAAAAGRLTVQTQPSSSATAGTAFATQPIIRIEDLFGNLIASDSATIVSAARNLGSASLQGTTTAKASAGIATFTNLSYTVAEIINLSFSGGSLTGTTSSNITVNPAAANKLTILTQPPAAAIAGVAFSPQPQVRIEDQYGNLRSSDNTTVVSAARFTGTGALQGVTNATASAGVAAFSNLSYPLVETMKIAFNSSGLTSATSSNVVVSSAPFVKLQLLMPGETAAPGTATGKTGTPLAQTAAAAFNVTVNAVDANWNLINTNDTVGISSSDANAVLPATAALSGGTKTFSVTFKTSGSQTLTATDLTDGTRTANTSPSIQVNAGAFAKLQLLTPGETAAPGTGLGKTGTPSAQTAGTAFNITVNAVDACWNLINTNDTIAITCSDPNAALPANAALVSGSKSFSVTAKTAGTATVTAADTTHSGITSNSSPAITVNPGAFAKLQLLAPGELAAPGTAGGKTGAPAAQVAGTPFNLTVRAVDTNWNLVPAATDLVAITSSDANAILPSSAALVSGTQTFSVTLKTVGGRTLTATDSDDGAKTPSTSPSITVSAGAFTKLQLLAPGESAAPGSVSGKAGTPAAQSAAAAFNVTVNAVDACWNVVTNVTHTVGLTSSDTRATLPANAALIAGTKTLSITLNSVGGLTVSANDITDGSKTANTSPAITVNPGVANKLTMQTPPSAAATAGVALAQQPILRVEDAAGNLVTNDSGRVITAARGTGTGTLQGTLTAATANGLATFINLSYNVAETITMSFTASGLTGTNSGNIVVSPAPADRVVFTTQPGGVSRIGSSWASQPVVKAQDPFGNSSTVGLPANLDLSLSLTSGSGSLLGTTTLDIGTAAGNGTATFTGLQCSDAGIGKQLTASASGLTSATSAAFIVGGAAPATGGSAVSADTVGGSYTLLSGPTYYEAATGDVSAGTIILNAPTGFVFDTTNTPAPTVIVTRLSGSGGNTNNINDLASGAAAAVTSRTTNQITFTVSAASASGVTCSLTWTNVRVRPSAGTPLASGNLTKTGTATMAAVTASNTSLGALTEVVGAATRLAFSTQPGAATAGAAFGTQPVVRSRDQFGNDSTSGLPANRTVTLTLSSGTGPLLGSASLDIGTAAGNGVAGFSGLELDVAGTNKQFTATASGMTNASSSLFTVNPASASKLTIQTQPSAAATAGVVFAQQPVVRIEDSFGNLRSSDNSTTVTVSRNAGSGVLQGTTTRTAVNGVVSFTNLSHQVAGTITLDFASSGLAGATSASVVVSPAAASKLTIQTQPSATATAGVVFAAQPVVRIEDAFGNLRSSDSLTVTATRSAGSGTLQGTTSLSAVNGVATFNNLSHTVATNITIQFASGSLTSATSGSIAVGANTPNRLTIQTQPSAAATAGVAFAQQPVIRIEDAFANLIGSDNSTVITASRNAGSGSLQGNVNITAVNGVATFTDLSHNVATNITIQFAGGSLTGATSSSITVSPGAASQLTMRTQPAASATAGVLFTQQPSLRIEDQFGNLRSNDNATVITATRSAGSGVLQGTTNLTAVNGVVTYTNLSHNVAADITIAFTSGSLNGATSSTIAVSPAAANRLTIQTHPSPTATVAVAFSQQPVIRIEDQFGNLRSGDNSTSVTATRSSGSGTLQGVTAITAVNGVVSYTNLAHNVASTITVLFTSGSLSNATSGNIVVTAAPATRLAIQTQPSASATAGVTFAQQPAVRIEDAFGNLVSSDNTTVVTATRNTGTGALQGTATATATGGVATFANLSYNVAETLTISFSSSGSLTSTNSANVAVSPAAANKLTILTQPASNAVAGVAFAPQPVIRIEDAFGNLRSSDNTTVVTATRASGSGTLQGTTNLTALNGVVSYTNLAHTVATNITITFSSGSLSNATSSSIAVSPAVANRLFFATQPGSATAGSPFAMQPVLKSQDQYGNDSVVGLGGSLSLSLSLSSGSGPLQGTTSLDIGTNSGNGLVSFSNLEIDSAGINKQLTAIAGGLSNAVSSVFSVSAAGADHLTIQTQPSSAATAGSVFGQQPVVRIEDAYGNLISSDNSTVVTASRATGSAALQGTVSRTAVNGLVSFTNLSYNVAETITLGFAGGSLTGTTSANVAVSAAAANRLTIQTQPSSSATAGTAFSQQPVIRIEDSFGNLRSSDNSTVVTATRSAGSGTLQGTTNMTAAGGLVTFNNLAHNVANTISLNFSSGTLSNAVSSSVVVGSAAFSKLLTLAPGEAAAPGTGTGKSGSPTTQTAGTAFNITANAVDAFWNLVNSVSDTIAISSSDSNASLPANAALVSGSKVLSVTLKTAGSATVTATDADDGSKSASSSIPVNAGALAKLQVLVPGETAAPGTATGKTGTPSAEAAGTAFNVTVNAVDANWNVVSTNDTVGITSSDLNATLPANAALVSGSKSFSVTLKTGGSATVMATDFTHGGVTANTSPSIAVNSGGFTKLQILLPGETAAPGTGTGKSGSPVAQTAGSAFSVTVNAVDANWNLVSNVADAVGISSSDANAVLPANAALVSGTKAFSVTLKTAGSATVTATDSSDGSKTANTSSTVTVGAGAFVKLQLLAPGETAVPGTASGKTGTPSSQIAASAYTVTVNAVDANWNLVANVADTITLTCTDPNDVLPPNSALVGGTKALTLINKTAGSWTLTASDFSDGTKAPNTSPPVTVNAGPFTKLQLLTPGESAAPGTVSGKIGAPNGQTAGSAYAVTVNAVDANWNLVSTATDTVSLSCTDPNDVLPANAALASGTKSLTLTDKTAGAWTITATDVTDGSKAASTSPAVTVSAGAFSKLQLLVPGETAAPGSASGKTGTPSGQVASTTLSIIVNAVDASWNTVSGVTDNVGISSSDATASLPANSALVSGTQTFSAAFNTNGSFTLTSSDLSDGSKTASTSPAISVSAARFTPATGGNVILADTVGGTFTALTGPVYTEKTNAEVGVGTIILNTPAGFVLDTGGTAPTVRITSTGPSAKTINGVSSGTSVAMSSVTATQLTFTVTTPGSGGTLCTLTWQNVRVRPTAGSPLASGNLRVTGTASVVGVSTNSNFGTLIEAAGAASRLAIQTQPASSATAGIAFNPQPVVRIEDQFGNLRSIANGNADNSTVVTAARSAGSGTLQGTLTATASAGLATFTNLSHNVATNITIGFTSGSLTSTTSTSIVVSPAAAAQLVFTSQPANGVVGGVLTNQPALRSRDSFGNNSTVGLGASKMVSLILSSGTGPFLGTTSLDIGTNAGNGAVSFSDLRIDSAGTNKQLTASASGLSNAVSSTFSVAKGSQSVSFGALASKTYGDPSFTVSATASSSLAVSFSIVSGPATIAGNTVTTTGAGTVTVRVSQAGDANWNAAANVDQSFTVAKALLTVTADDKSRTYGAANPAFTASYSGFVNGQTLATSGVTGSPALSTAATTNSPVAGSPYTITVAQGTLASANYSFTFVNGSLSVTRATLNVTADNKSRTYGDANPALTASYTGFVNGETASVLSGSPALSATATTNSPVGGSPYTITAAIGSLNAANYSFAFANGGLTVTKATLTVTADNKSKVYGAANPPLTVSYSGFVNGEDQSVISGSPSLSTSADASSTVAGSPYPITVGLGSLNAANYSFALVNGTLSVTPYALTVLANDASRSYGQTNPPFSGTLTGVQNGDNITATYTSTAAANSPVGNSAITPVLADPNGRLTNYTVFSTNGTLTIGAANLTVVANDASRSYGQTNPLFSGTLSGVQNGDNITATYTSAANASSPAGTYAIVPSLIDPDGKASNYSLQSSNGTFTITKALLLVTADDQSRVFGAADPVFTASYSGFVNGENLASSGVTGSPDFSTTATAGSSVAGSPYSITPGVGTLSAANYQFGFASGLLTITPASVTGTLVSSLNPSPTGSNVTFTASLVTVAPGSGTPAGQVSFETDGVPMGSPVTMSNGVAALTVSDLAHGNHTVKALYFPEVDFLGTTNEVEQSVNSPPVAQLATYTGLTNSIEIPVQDLLTNFTSDADGDLRTLTALGTGTNGTATVSGEVIIYTLFQPAPSCCVTDLFDYVVTDGFVGCLVTNKVCVCLGAPASPPPAQLTGITALAEGIRLTISGAPGYTHHIERCAGIGAIPGEWEQVGTVTFNLNGQAEFIDTNRPPDRAFYRAVWP